MNYLSKNVYSFNNIDNGKFDIPSNNLYNPIHWVDPTGIALTGITRCGIQSTALRLNYETNGSIKQHFSVDSGNYHVWFDYIGDNRSHADNTINTKEAVVYVTPSGSNTILASGDASYDISTQTSWDRNCFIFNTAEHTKCTIIASGVTPSNSTGGAYDYGMVVDNIVVYPEGLRTHPKHSVLQLGELKPGREYSVSVEIQNSGLLVNSDECGDLLDPDGSESSEPCANISDVVKLRIPDNAFSNIEYSNGEKSISFDFTATSDIQNITALIYGYIFVDEKLPVVYSITDTISGKIVTKTHEVICYYDIPTDQDPDDDAFKYCDE